jgi:hypothetical protein
VEAMTSTPKLHTVFMLNSIGVFLSELSAVISTPRRHQNKLRFEIFP